MKLIKTSLILFIFFININVFALEECTNEKLNTLKELAKNVNFSYDYEIIDDKYYETDEYTFKNINYSIKAVNLNDDLKVRLVNDNESVFTKDNPILSDFTNGETVKIEIIAFTLNLCSGEVLLTKTINLPNINIYSIRDECKNYQEFKYCKEIGDFDITDEEFLTELEKYKEEQINNNKDNSNDKNFVEKYILYIIIGLIIIILITVFIINKYIKKKKESDF